MIYRLNNHACTPMINRPTNRQALCLTTIITVAGTVLLPGQTAAMLTADSDLTVAALPAAYWYFAAPACSTTTDSCCLPPAAKPTLCCLTAFLQRHKYKERTASVGIYGQEYMDRGYVVVYLISHPYGWLISLLFRYCDSYDSLFSTPIRQESIQQLIGHISALMVIQQKYIYYRNIKCKIFYYYNILVIIIDF